MEHQREKKPLNTLVFSRKELRGEARLVLKRHYRLFVIMCLVAVFFKAEFITSDYVINLRRDTLLQAIRQDEQTQVADEDGEDTLYRLAAELIREKVIKNEKLQEIFGQSSGVLAGIARGLSSGSLPQAIASAVVNVLNSDDSWMKSLIILAGLIMLSSWFLIQRMYVSVMRRIALPPSLRF